MNNKDKTPKARALRSNSTSANSSDEVSMSRIEQLITQKINDAVTQLENKICSKLDRLLNKIDVIEGKLENVQVEQLRLSIELDKVKEIIVDQQRLIERTESAKRLPFLMVSGVSESEIRIDGQSLSTDLEKISYLCTAACNSKINIQSCVRVGNSSIYGPRLLKIGFFNINDRHEVLRSQSKLRRNFEFITDFGRVFINPDASPLTRKEDKRLRQAMNQIRESADKSDKVYIKRGQLFKNSEVIDRFDIRNQLF